MICQRCHTPMEVLKDKRLETVGDIIDPFAFSGENTEIWYCTKCGHMLYLN